MIFASEFILLPLFFIQINKYTSYASFLPKRNEYFDVTV